MLNNLSLRKKILLLIGGTITVLLILASTFFIKHIADLSRVNIEREAQSYLQSEQLSMQGYFARYGKVVSTFVNNPHLVNFFEAWEQRDQPVANAPGYSEINQDFVRISAHDENILSAFFASAITGEYFKENERTSDYNGQPYYAYKRGWWQEAMQLNKLYVGPISVDLTTGDASAVVQQPVYNEQKKLIGIGGVDLQLNKINAMVESIRFNNQGYGFLLDSNQKVVHLSKATKHNLSITDDGTKKKQGLDGLEQQFENTSGFETLNQQMQKNLQGSYTVTFKGEQYYVVYSRLQLEQPFLDWYVGLLIPTSLIEAPVNDAVKSTVTTVADMDMVQTFAELCAATDADDDAIALTALAEVEPGGHFFGASHTMDRYQTAFYEPVGMDWSNIGTWTERGAQDANTRATAVWKAILRDFVPPEMPAERVKRLDDYIARRTEQGGAAPES